MNKNSTNHFNDSPQVILTTAITESRINPYCLLLAPLDLLTSIQRGLSAFAEYLTGFICIAVVLLVVGVAIHTALTHKAVR